MYVPMYVISTKLMYMDPLGASAAINGDSSVICCCFVSLVAEEHHNRVRATCELPKGKLKEQCVCIKSV